MELPAYTLFARLPDPVRRERASSLAAAKRFATRAATLPNMSLGVDKHGDGGEAGDKAADRVTAELRAIAHPVRLRILSLLTGASMTAADVARELGLTHANASYHLRQLHAAGVIDAAGEERIRGGAAKRYRYVVGKERDKPTEHNPAHLPHRRALYAAAAAELRRRADFVRHTPAGGHLTDAELWVTPELWGEVKAQVNAASDRLHRSALAPRSPGAIRVNASFAMFEMEPSDVAPSNAEPSNAQRSEVDPSAQDPSTEEPFAEEPSEVDSGDLTPSDVGTSR